MMQNDEIWESGIDWSKRTSVVGGPVFYEFITTQALPALDEGIQALEAAKAVCEDKMRRWGAIAERAGKLAECFASLTEFEDFMRMIRDFDEKTMEMFKGEAIPTLGDRLRLGKRFTDAMRDGSSVPTKYASELAGINRDIANATAVRDVFRAYVSASDDDYRLRCAPERYRMRVFRDFSKDVGDIADAGVRVNFVSMPDFLNGVCEALKVIIEVGNRMQGICRRAKKSIKRHGNALSPCGGLSSSSRPNTRFARKRPTQGNVAGFTPQARRCAPWHRPLKADIKGAVTPVGVQNHQRQELIFSNLTKREAMRQCVYISQKMQKYSDLV